MVWISAPGSSRRTAVLVLAACLIPAAATAGRLPRYGGDVRIQIAAIPTDLDPLILAGDDGEIVAACLYEGLTRWGEVEVQPALAGGWVHDEDSHRWLFRLRADVVFHDGTRCDAQAVKESLSRLADPGQSRYAWILSDLVGWDDFAAGRTQVLSGLEAPQPDEIELQFMRPVSDLPARLAIPAAAIVRRRGPERLGTGPFRLVSRTPEALRLAAFREHHDGRPFLDHVDLTVRREAGMVLWSRVAEMARVPPADGFPGGAERLRAPAQRLGLAIIQPESQALSSETQRRRLADSFDRALFVRAALAGDGQGAAGLAPQAARLIAARAGESQGDLVGQSQQRVRIVVAASEPVLRALGERLQAHLFALGMNADLDVLPAPALAAALAAHSYDVVVLGWTPPQPRAAQLDASTRVRLFLSSVAMPVLGKNVPASWAALVSGGAKDPEATLLRGAFCIPLVFFHDTWQTTADVLDLGLGTVAANLGLADAHLDTSAP